MKKTWQQKTTSELRRMSKGLGKGKGRVVVQGLTEKQVQRLAKAELDRRNPPEEKAEA